MRKWKTDLERDPWRADKIDKHEEVREIYRLTLVVLSFYALIFVTGFEFIGVVLILINQRVTGGIVIGVSVLLGGVIFWQKFYKIGMGMLLIQAAANGHR